MNIYTFLNNVESSGDLQFTNNLIDRVSFKCAPDLSTRLAAEIEIQIKKRFLHIVELEKKVAIEAGLTSNAQDFIDKISNTDEWKEYFFEEYPVLSIYYDKAYKKIKALITELFLRLENDYSLLGFTHEITLLSIQLGEGDFHAGKSTCQLEFSGEQMVYYKPRSLKIDILTTNLLQEYESKIGKELFYPVKNIDRGAYGWSIGVDKKLPFLSQQDVANYYQAVGYFLAIAHALKIEDIIHDNIIPVGGRLSLIDLECVACVSIPFNKELLHNASTDAGHIYRESIIKSGIVPRNTFEGFKQDGESDAVLSFLPKRRVSWQKDKYISSTESHIPVLNGVHQPIKKYYPEFLASFEEGYLLLQNQKEWLLKFVDLLAENEIKTRIIWRATRIYEKILQEGFTYERLNNVEAYNDLLDKLHSARRAGFPEEITHQEIEQLKDFDIPYFQKVVGKNEVLLHDGRSVGIKYASENDVRQVKKRINSLCETDLQNQKHILVNSLKVFDEIEFKYHSLPWHNQTDKKQITSHLKEILISNLHAETGKYSYLELYTNANNAWRLGPIGPGLSSGTDGVAIVFGIDGIVNQDEGLQNTARDIALYNRSILLEKAKNLENFAAAGHYLFSPFQFPLSVVYSNEYLKSLGILSEGFDEELHKVVCQYLKSYYTKDTTFDFLIGICGAVFLYYQLYLKYQKEQFRDIVEMAASFLRSKAIEENGLVYFETEKFYRLGGFSHGTSSYALAFLMAHRLSGDSQHYEYFEKSLRYDRSLFLPDQNAFKDNRYPEQEIATHAYAHGSGGIGLSRVLIAQYEPEYAGIKEELEICKTNLDRVINDKSIHSVIGGYSGNFEILKSINNYLNRDNKYLDQILDKKIESIESGEISLVKEKNHLHLFFNQGIAGLLYAIHRNRNLSKIPSVLTLDIDTSHHKYLYGR